jgi:hypothetical protein
MTDTQWFRNKIDELDLIYIYDDIENFKERVAIMHLDGGVEIDRARLLSFNKIMGVV